MTASGVSRALGLDPPGEHENKQKIDILYVLKLRLNMKKSAVQK